MIYLAITVTHAVCIINTSQCLIITWGKPRGLSQPIFPEWTVVCLWWCSSAPGIECACVHAEIQHPGPAVVKVKCPPAKTMKLLLNGQIFYSALAFKLKLSLKFSSSEPLKCVTLATFQKPHVASGHPIGQCRESWTFSEIVMYLSL